MVNPKKAVSLLRLRHKEGQGIQKTFYWRYWGVLFVFSLSSLILCVCVCPFVCPCPLFFPSLFSCFGLFLVPSFPLLSLPPFPPGLNCRGPQVGLSFAENQEIGLWCGSWGSADFSCIRPCVLSAVPLKICSDEKKVT